MQKRFLFNGKIVEQGQAVISAANKAAFFGYGVYESIRVFRGKPFYLEWHLKRFFESARAIEIEVPYSPEELSALTRSLIEKNNLDDALIRLVYYGKTEKEGGILAGFPMGFHYYPDRAYSKGMSAVTFRHERILPHAKTLSLLGGFLGLREAAKKGAIEALFVNRKGEVTEGTRSNFFIVDKNGKLITAPNATVLEGITRKVLIDNLPRDISFCERSIPLEEIFSAKEVFATSTVFGVMPLVEIDGKKIGGGKAGEITKRLGSLYSAHVKENCSKPESHG